MAVGLMEVSSHRRRRSFAAKLGMQKRTMVVYWRV